MITIFEKDLKIPLLLDVYGELLSSRKREMMDYYYNEDYSLAEISEVTGISRQGVRDSIKKTVAELHDMEDKLHMAQRLTQLEQAVEKVTLELRSVIDTVSDENIKGKLTEILTVITEMED